jgi:hypothetical protein
MVPFWANAVSNSRRVASTPGVPAGWAAAAVLGALVAWEHAEVAQARAIRRYR